MGRSTAGSFPYVCHIIPKMQQTSGEPQPPVRGATRRNQPVVHASARGSENVVFTGGLDSPGKAPRVRSTSRRASTASPTRCFTHRVCTRNRRRRRRTRQWGQYTIDFAELEPGGSYTLTLPSLGSLVQTWTVVLENEAVRYDRDQELINVDGDRLDALGIAITISLARPAWLWC
jgi:hypothetical protein